MTIRDLRLIFDGVVGNLPIVIVGSDGVEASVKNIVATVDTKRIEIATDAKLPIYDRDKPIKMIESGYKYGNKYYETSYCPVCGNKIRLRAKYCDVCGQALER